MVVSKFWCKGRMRHSVVLAETARCGFSLLSVNGQLRLALEMFGNAVILRNTSSHGFRDFATSSHMSAYEAIFSRCTVGAGLDTTKSIATR
jgi:hypothetical protein